MIVVKAYQVEHDLLEGSEDGVENVEIGRLAFAVVGKTGHRRDRKLK